MTPSFYIPLGDEYDARTEIEYNGFVDSGITVPRADAKAPGGITTKAVRF